MTTAAPGVTTTQDNAPGAPALELRHVDAYYGAAQVLFELSIVVRSRQVVAVIGANGAGKSTALNVITGRVAVAQGDVLLDGLSIRGKPTHEVIAGGVACCPQRRRIFGTMSVMENLEVGGYVRRRQKEVIAQGLDEVFRLFPVLKRKAGELGGVLSGGEQQMLAIGRAIMAQPRILLLDEPSMGLSPKLTTEVFQDIRRIAESGRTIMLVEQNAYAALGIADFGYVLEGGRVALSGLADQLVRDDYVRQAYLGA